MLFQKSRSISSFCTLRPQTQCHRSPLITLSGIHHPIPQTKQLSDTSPPLANLTKNLAAHSGSWTLQRALTESNLISQNSQLCIHSSRSLISQPQDSNLILQESSKTLTSLPELPHHPILDALVGGVLRGRGVGRVLGGRRVGGVFAVAGVRGVGAVAGGGGGGLGGWGGGWS